MAIPKGIDWKNVSFVLGKCEDAVAEKWKENAAIRNYGNCGEKTYLEVEYPNDVTILCNVCALQYAKIIEQDPRSLLTYDMPVALKARIVDMSETHKGLPKVTAKTIDAMFAVYAGKNGENISPKSKRG